MRTFAFVVLLVLLPFATSWASTATDSNQFFSIGDIEQVEMYCLSMDDLKSIATPEFIRTNPEYYFRSGSQLASQQDRIKEILAWLKLEQMASYKLEAHPNEPQATLASMMVVIDFTLKNGSKVSFLANTNFLYSESLTFRRSVSCDFTNYFLDKASLGHRSDIANTYLRLCNENRERK